MNVQKKINSSQIIEEESSEAQEINQAIQEEKIEPQTNNLAEVKENILQVNNIISQEVDKLKITNPELKIEEKLLINVNEVLASPN